MHTCPGRCGTTITHEVLACWLCTETLPPTLFTTIVTTGLARDWPAHSRALTQSLHWFATREEMPCPTS